MGTRKVLLAVAFCGLILLTGSGCATIICGSTQKIPISSTPSGAKVTADTGTSIVTPGSIVLERKSAHTLVAEYPGRGQQQQKLEKKLNNWVWGNILIGGLIGLVIDIVSGSINELQPKEVHFNFEKATTSSSTNMPIVFEDMLFERCNRHRLSRTYQTAA